jgi:hypothetical protein
MLFGYPIEATKDNWLHDCMVSMLESIHANPYQKPDWPNIIPEAYRESLNNRDGLKDRLITYQEGISKLNPTELDQVKNALIEQNEIADLLACHRNCAMIDQLPKPIREPAKALFEFSFSLLTPLGIRDRHYKVIYESSRYNICPFCGCEYFDAPDAPRVALDHYLLESKYPFVAANLENLVPMGDKCNSKYKLQENILYKADGVTRRKAIYPYQHSGIRISLDRSRPFLGDMGILSPNEWEIDFDPQSEEAETWDDVFHIRERYKRDILDRSFRQWLDDFAAWYSQKQLRVASFSDVTEALKGYASIMEFTGTQDRAFLKAAVFRMLYSECEKGNQTVRNIISGLVAGAGSSGQFRQISLAS